MTTLNEAFKHALISEDMGYERGCESMSVSIPLHQEP